VKTLLRVVAILVALLVSGAAFLEMRPPKARALTT
jgi:hypothetical protein